MFDLFVDVIILIPKYVHQLMTSTATIPDIARHAGVSTATVDRVLNGRPGVNDTTVQKVIQAVAALGQPTVLRGRPRARDNLRFAYLLPDDDVPFFNQVERQIAQAAGDFRHQHITEITHRFNGEDPAEFAASLAQVSDCDGIALIAPDLPAVKLAINEQVRKGVHVVTLFSDVAGSMREAYVGVDNRAAGRTAALLLARMACDPQRDTLLLVACDPQRDTLLLVSPVTRMSAEIERRIGFVQVIEERFSRLRVLRSTDLPLDEEEAYLALTQFLRNEADAARLGGVYCVGSSSAGVIRALEEVLGAGHMPGVIAHGVTDLNQSLLVGDKLAYLLHQDIHYCVMTAAKVLHALCENVRGALNVVQPRVEILTAENLH